MLKAIDVPINALRPIAPLPCTMNPKTGRASFARRTTSRARLGASAAQIPPENTPRPIRFFVYLREFGEKKKVWSLESRVESQKMNLFLTLDSRLQTPDCS